MENKEKHIDLEKEKRKSLLDEKSVYVTDKIKIHIPTVGEILQDEQTYYNIVNSFTSVPYQWMVQLDDMGIDFSTITDYKLFLMLFPLYAKSDLSLVFDDLYTDDYEVYIDNTNGTEVLYSPTNGKDYTIDEYVYTQIVNTLRRINNLERIRKKPGNDTAKKYLIDLERKKQKRRMNKEPEQYLEKLVIALVNSPEFKYNYSETKNLSIYNFNQSFKQIQTRITYETTRIGIYSGTVDTSKLSDKSCLSWIPIK